MNHNNSENQETCREICSQKARFQPTEEDDIAPKEEERKSEGRAKAVCNVRRR